MSNRMEKVNMLMKREISSILQQEVNDPRVQFVTITRVEVSRDLRVSRVFFSVLGSVDGAKKAEEGLKKASGYIRKLIGSRVAMRYTPEINFIYDKNIEYSVNMGETLDEIKKELDQKDPESEEYPASDE